MRVIFLFRISFYGRMVVGIGHYFVYRQKGFRHVLRKGTRIPSYEPQLRSRLVDGMDILRSYPSIRSKYYALIN